MKVLVTGGAGFIGGHVVHELLDRGYEVRVLDSLVPEVHGPKRERPSYLNPDVELLIGDVRNREEVLRALRGMDAVIHLAALVGAAQSMRQTRNYTEVNNVGTATLLEAITERPVGALVVASSMSIYGEGLYCNSRSRTVLAQGRNPEHLRMGVWEVLDEYGSPLIPLPTPEIKLPLLASVYALSKFDQEQMSLMMGAAYQIPVVALRLFNAYGPNQALSNPDPGVLSNFALRVLNDRAPLIYEDGLQQRDFVSVYDIARACRLALEQPEAAGRAINISSGRAMTVLEVAERTIRALGRPGIEPEITGTYRADDIRHCFADISLAKSVLGWAPQIPFAEGLEDLAAWLEGQMRKDRALDARAELASRGQMV